MKYLSVCSGIEAASVAWHPLGWEPVGFSEIEPFPSAVLAHHYPHVPNFGDMTKFQEWPLDAGAIDLLVGGTPCQSFSVAGLRQGLKDPRGNLMLTYLAIAARLRPRWVVWENVPGVLSSNGGRDFGSFLGGLGQLGYGFAYRVLDAQWVRTHGHPRAVPQRRRRVFVVGCLGDATAAAKVLFERESVQRHIKKSGAAREEIAADAKGSVGTGCWWDGGNTSDTLTKCGANGAQRMPDKDNFGAVLQPLIEQVKWPADVAPTLNQSRIGSGSPGYSNQELFSQGGGGLIPVLQPFDQQQNGAYGVGQVGSTRLAREHKGPTDLVAVPYTKAKRAQSDTDDETWVEGQVNPTLSLFDCGDVRATTAIAIPILPQAMQADGWRVGKENKDGRGNGLGVGKDGDPCPTLDRSAVPAVAIQGSMIGRQDHNGPAGSGCSGNGEMFTLTSTDVHAVAFHPTQDPISSTDGSIHAMGCGSSGGCATQAVAFPINTMTLGGRPDEANDRKMTMGVGADGDPQFTLQAAHSHAVGTDIHSCVITGDVAATMGTKGSAVNGHGPTLMQAMTVRRLTPRECERLQGFPDDYTLIPWRKKAASDCPDGPRYKALGNSMAVNCMAWIGERIAAVEAERGTT